MVCPKYIGRVVRKQDGSIVENPLCMSPRCSYCQGAVIQRWLDRGYLGDVYNCHVTFASLQFYYLRDDTVIAKILEEFWKRMRKHHEGEIAYQYCWEMKGNLLHCHCIIYSDQAIDLPFAQLLFASLIALHATGNVTIDSLNIQKPESITSVITYGPKIGREEAYTPPPVWVRKMVLYGSRNLSSFLHSHGWDGLAPDMLR